MLADRRPPPPLSLGLSLSLLLLLTLFAIAPLTRPGFPITAAGFLPVWELSAPAVFLRLLGAEPRLAVKAALGLAYALGGVGVYAWLRRRWSEPAALVAGVLYAFLPYRLAVLYVAGDMAETWALALMPWAGWALDAFARQPAIRHAALALSAWGLLAAFHSGLAICFALGAGGALALARRSPWALLPLAPAVPLAIWRMAVGSAGDFHSQYVALFQLFSASWNVAPNGPTWINAMPLQLGLVPLGLAGLALALNRRGRPAPLLLAGGFALACLLALPISAPIWRLTRFDHLLAAPWQVLGFAGLGLTLLSGQLVARARPLATLPGLAGLLALCLVSVYAYLAPAWTEIQPWPYAIVFGEKQIALADYRVIGKVYPGAQVQVDVTWQCLRRLDKDYTVFVQARDPTNKIQGQQDVQPRAGKSPTSGWLPGQIITDTYVINVDPKAPEADYNLLIGFYDWQSGARLQMHSDLLRASVGAEYNLLLQPYSSGADPDD